MSQDAEYLDCDIYIVYPLLGAVITKSVEWLLCGLEQQRLLSRQGYEIFFNTQNFRTDSMTHPALYSTDTERYFPGGEAVRVRKWIFTSIYWRG
jgi:hypothetical protein